MVKVFPPCFMGCHGSGIMCPCTQGGRRAILVRLVGYSDRSFTRRSYILDIEELRKSSEQLKRELEREADRDLFEHRHALRHALCDREIASMALYHAAFLVVLATVAGPADASLFAQLMGVQYKNNGTVHSSDAFTTAGIDCLYLEPEQVTTPRHSWADGSGKPHIYMFAAAAENATCAASSPQPGMDRPGSDLSQVVSSPSPGACGRSCCGNPACAAWVFAPEAPATWQGCTKGVSCCYLKSAAGATSPKAGLTSGAVTRAGGPTAAPPSKGIAPQSLAPHHIPSLFPP